MFSRRPPITAGRGRRLRGWVLRRDRRRRGRRCHRFGAGPPGLRDGLRPSLRWGRAPLPQHMTLPRRVGLNGGPRSDLEPYWSAQTTRGVDAHFGRPAMRTGLPVHPLARQRLSASPPRSPVAHGPLGPWTVATPLAEGSVRVRGQVCLRTPAPDPFGSLPHQQSLRGKAVRVPLRGGGAPVRRPAGRRAVRHRRAGPGRVRHGSTLAFPHGTAGSGATSGEGVRDVHIPTLRDARTGHRNREVAPIHV